MHVQMFVDSNSCQIKLWSGKCYQMRPRYATIYTTQLFWADCSAIRWNCVDFDFYTKSKRQMCDLRVNISVGVCRFRIIRPVSFALHFFRHRARLCVSAKNVYVHVKYECPEWADTDSKCSLARRMRMSEFYVTHEEQRII